MVVVAFVGCSQARGEPDGTIGFTLTESEIRESGKYKNIPIYDRHQHDKGPVGRIAKTWCENGKMLVAGVVSDRTPVGKKVCQELKSGILKGLSLGIIHGVRRNKAGKVVDVLWKDIVDVSVCEEGDLPGTHIMTVAAKQAVEQAIQDEEENRSLFGLFYASHNVGGTEQADVCTKAIAETLSQQQQQQQSIVATMADVLASSQQTGGMPPFSALSAAVGDKRIRDDTPAPPNIPFGMRMAATTPTSAQQSLIDPLVHAANEALKKELQQQIAAAAAALGEPAAKKLKTDDNKAPPPDAASLEAQKKKDNDPLSDNNQPVPMTKKEYTELLKFQAENEEKTKKLQALEKQLAQQEEKIREWSSAASESFGPGADAKSLRDKVNQENEEQAKQAHEKVKEAMKMGKEIKKALVDSGHAPSKGFLTNFERLAEYHKSPDTLLKKQCRDEVVGIVDMIGDCNQARLLTVASKAKATAQLEVQLDTSQKRLKELTEMEELRRIGDAGRYQTPSSSSMTGSKSVGQEPRRASSQTFDEKSEQPQMHNWFSGPDSQPARTNINENTKDCWTNAHQYNNNQQELMTTASHGRSGIENTQERSSSFSHFYSNSSPLASKVDPGPPTRRPPANFDMRIAPLDSTYSLPVSEETAQYDQMLKQRLRFGTGQGRFAIPAFTGQEYLGENAGKDLPERWQTGDHLTFGKGKPF